MERFLDAAKAWLTLLSTKIADFVLHWLIVPFLLAVAAGTGVWTITHPKLIASLAENQIPKDERYVVLAYIGVAVVLMALCIAGFMKWYRNKNHRWPDYLTVSPVHRLMSFLVMLPIVGVLDMKRIQRDDPIFVIFLISLGAVACFPTFVEITRIVAAVAKRFRIGPEDAEAEKQSVRSLLLKYAPDLVVFLLFIAYSVHFSTLAVNGLQALRTRTTDMAIYTNILFHSAHGDFLGCSIMRTGNHAAAHFDPILILFSPFYMLYPRPEFLGVLQATWLGFGVFPAFWLGRRVLKSGWAGVGVAFVYALHPCLHQVNLFEFHSLALIASPVLLAIFLIEAGYYKRLFALLPFILMIREDVSLLMCFVGAAAILTHRKQAWVGTLVILLSILYFVTIKFLFMASPDMIMSGKGVYNYSGYFDFMMPHREGVRGLLTSILTNPVYAIRQLISMEKLLFILRLLGPFMLIPLLAKQRRMMLLYAVVFLLLASKPAVFSNRFHYQIIAFPMLMGLLPFGIERLLGFKWFGLRREQFLTALLGTLLVAGVMHGVMFGALTQTKTRSAYAFTLGKEQQKRFGEVLKMVAMIPPKATVTASYDLAPYVSNRWKIYSMNHFRPKKPTDYLFLDRKKTKDEQVVKYDRQVAAGIYKPIAQYRHIVLYKLDAAKYRQQQKSKSKSKRRSKKAGARHLKAR